MVYCWSVPVPTAGAWRGEEPCVGLVTVNHTDIKSQERLLSSESYSILIADVRHRMGNDHFQMTEWFASSSLLLVGNWSCSIKKKDCFKWLKL